MRVFAISDLHLSINNPKPMDVFGEVWSGYLDEIADFWRANIAEDDAVLIAGDISWAMTLEGVKPDLDYIAAFPGKKILLRGNHDYWWHSISALRAILPAGMYAVQNDCLRLGKLLVCGTRGWIAPDSKAFSPEDRKIYDRELIRLGLSLDEMKKMREEGDRAVAMIHYPPFCGMGEPSAFTEMFSEYGVDAVVYGHLHGKNVFARPLYTLGGVPYYLTSCDLVSNKPVLIAEVSDD